MRIVLKIRWHRGPVLLCGRSGNLGNILASNLSETCTKEIPLSKIARRKFLQLSAVAAAGCFVQPGREAQASDLPQLSEDDPMAKAMKYTNDASSVDPSTRNNPAADQTCANCALIQADAGDWRPCQIFPGKAVNAAGWCSVWAPKA
jgi:hypothetical protein